MIKKILFFPFSIFWITLSGIECYAVYILFDGIFIDRYAEYLFICFGFAAYIVTLPIIPPNKYNFWNTLIHELSHAIAAIFTFARPHQLFVTDKAVDGQLGYTGYSYKTGIMGMFRSHLVSLSPYYFPFITLFFCIIYLIVKPDKPNFIQGLFTNPPSLNGLFFIIGLSYCYHLIISFRDAKPHQSDFHSLGYVYGITFVVFMQLFFLILFLLIISSDHGGFKILVKRLPWVMDYVRGLVY